MSFFNSLHCNLAKFELFGFLTTCGFLLVSCTLNKQHDGKSLDILLESPADNWNEAIPIGNGSLGGMVYGGIHSDTIKLNEETLWSGGPRDIQNYTAIQYLPRIRQLLFEDKTKEAEDLIDSTMLGPWNECYMPMGDLVMEYGENRSVEDYKRVLNLNSGIVTIDYKIGETQYHKEIFASYPDQAIIVRISTNLPGQLNFNVSLSSLLNSDVVATDHGLVMNGNAPKHAFPHYLGPMPPVYEDDKGMRFQVNLEVRNVGGKISKGNGNLNIQNADEVELLLTAATTFNGFDKDPVNQGRNCNTICENRITKLLNHDYASLKSRHLEDYRSLFNRVDLELGTDPSESLPIDKRINQYHKDQDPALTTLYFQFGRYLLISSSRPGKFAQPANLQGIWSRSLQPAWSANWTLNCNAEINYWAVESANLAECHLPLIQMVKELSVDGAKTAKNLYGSDGWVAHHNADIWRTTSPVGGSGLWAIYQVGSAWLCHHLWEHYLFSLDKEYLREVYPLMKEAAKFYFGTLQMTPDGFLVTSPAESFENHFLKPDGESGWACYGPTQDMQIVRDLFENCLKATEALGIDSLFAAQLIEKLTLLAPMKIHPETGRLQEWYKPWKANTPQNGQVAHGWGLAVGNQISPRETPKLASAFRKTLEHRKPRLAYNSGSWVGSFPAMFWARLHDGEMLQKVIDRHIDLAIFPNLTSKFGEYWEIDGNLGITAAIVEMLMQSHTGEIVLLPAVPLKYPNGSVKGLRARGGFLIDINWENHELVSVGITALTSNNYCQLRYKDNLVHLNLKKGDYKLIPFTDFNK